jgi:2-oxoglutarate-Fe(II)-dependent oxygenase superfamily protein
MTKTARERLARLFADAEPAGSFSTQLLAPAQVLELEVSGAGPVRLPVRAPLAKKLIAVARPAMFGRGEQTLTDTGVRDTWELTPDQFTLGGSGWTALLDGALEHFRDELGLPRRARLSVEPHSMLVYGKGQFFLPHQDSEKHDGMVGTLVVSLPSVHTGGELVIDHAGESRTYRASREDLTLVAFYSDCRHEVTPVRSGYRVTLTFNLLAVAETPAPEAGPVTELAGCLTEHFTTPATPRFGGRDLDPPNRLVFLLDHEYTQRGLAWRRLKGADAERATLLRSAAERAGCETVLALAEVKETWDVETSGGYGWEDYYEDDDGDPGDYQLTDLIDDEITLGWWTNPDGTGGESISLHVPDHEVCATTPSKTLEPYESEYEGYMGNYGNTLDRWYRRAAVVVWPPNRAFVARAEAGSQWALHELQDRIESGDLAAARAAAESLAPFWRRTAASAGLLDSALAVAAGLSAAGTAAMLLEPFRVETLTQEHAAGLAAAAGQYGQAWTRDVINGWFAQGRHYGTDRHEWVEQLPGLCEALRVAGRPEAARLLAAGTWRWLHDQLRTWTTTARTDIRRPRLEQLGSPLTRLLETVDDTQRGEISATLRGYGDTMLECLMPALRSVAPRRTAGLGEIARDSAQRLATILARPRREDDDWSIAWTGCRCELCDTLGTFLGSRTQRTLEWPLANDGRRHVHTQIDSADLPVRHQTRRQGRPYTLVLTKTDELFTRATTARHTAEVDLAWLTATWSDLSEARP